MKLAGIVSLIFLIVFGPGCASKLRITGRLAFREDTGCTSAVDSQMVDWTECHALKKHIDPSTGLAITSKQALGNYLVSRRTIIRAQLNALLRSQQTKARGASQLAQAFLIFRSKSELVP